MITSGVLGEGIGIAIVINNINEKNNQNVKKSHDTINQSKTASVPTFIELKKHMVKTLGFIGNNKIRIIVP